MRKLEASDPIHNAFVTNALSSIECIEATKIDAKVTKARLQSQNVRFGKCVEMPYLILFFSHAWKERGYPGPPRRKKRPRWTRRGETDLRESDQVTAISSDITPRSHTGSGKVGDFFKKQSSDTKSKVKTEAKAKAKTRSPPKQEKPKQEKGIGSFFKAASVWITPLFTCIREQIGLVMQFLVFIHTSLIHTLYTSPAYLCKPLRSSVTSLTT